MKDNAARENLGFLRMRRGFAYFILIFLTFLSLFSFYILFVNSTRSHPDIQKGFSFIVGGSLGANFDNLMKNANLPVLNGLMNSLIVAGLAAVFATYFSTMTAFGIHAYRFRLNQAAFSLIIMVMLVPTQVTALGFVRLMASMGLKNSFIPLTVPAIASPIVFFFMIQYMRSSLPIEVVEAARIDGAGEFYAFNRIVLPMMKPAIAVQAIFTFVSSWNNYFLPALILDSKKKQTVPILIAQLRSADFMKFDMGQVYLLIALAIFPVIVVYLCLSKFIVRGVALGSVKG
ncbi:MAG: carbohydrate ABC transporter permease [Clostridium sp.]|uniref:carbohydrate ABC transporter permease n=1 Tax=Clostridium sp. TaxID=1506 RepID=UPI002910BBE5|nr:carbohydrate ABC transporter permease [Clostridium sp.]MDU7338480.1 carbohydrate ABC transporter permease [Clostridium sp.]